MQESEYWFNSVGFASVRGMLKEDVVYSIVSMENFTLSTDIGGQRKFGNIRTLYRDVRVKESGLFDNCNFSI